MITLTIPIYVITGFLDAGKTTFLNNLFSKRSTSQKQILIIQFESGEEEFQSPSENCNVINIPKKLLEQNSPELINRLCSHIQGKRFDEIWIEWNGVAMFSKLQDIFLHPSLRKLCKINKVAHIADAGVLQNILGKTGNALPEQISNSDLIFIRNTASSKEFRRIKKLLHTIGPGTEIYKADTHDDLYEQIFRKKENPVNMFFMPVILIIMSYLLLKPLLELFNIPVNTMVNVFIGLLLQAVPFLLIGVLLSSAIQFFIPREVIERRFPKSLGAGMLAAILMGFCLPVCDCASIPIFRSLVKKGIPLPVAVTFMTVTPVINPVVILSTWYAFNSEPSIVFGRICLGIISAVIIGVVFAIRPAKGNVLSDGPLDKFMCSVGSYEEFNGTATFKEKTELFIRHSQAEFFNVGKYLVMGTFISSVMQTMGAGIFTAQDGKNYAVSIIVMMGLAFILSLCSSSDAIVARSFSNLFPTGAIMGFLVFGPMMDIKNLFMLSSGFTKSFIAKLFVIASIVCFVVVFLLGGS